MFIIIACIDQNRGLGYRSELLFHLKGDLCFFKETTSGHPVIMGRKTWKSLPVKLPGRQNIVVSRHPDSIPPKHPKTAQTSPKTPLNALQAHIQPQKAPNSTQNTPERTPSTPVTPDQIITNFEDFLKTHVNDPDPCFIIGGASVYQQALPYTKTLYLTEVAATRPADTFFPDFHPENYAKTLIEKGTENGLVFTISKYSKL